MRKFEIIRYLKQWRYLLLLIVIIGSYAIFCYGSNKQTYTAQAVIKYTHSEAAKGNNPDGTPINSSEIISASVITDAIKDLGMDETTVEYIRSKCSVEPIIPAEEQEKRTSALENGVEYEYFPVEYIVSFTVKNDKSKDYARDMLDSILTNYFEDYCRKYVDSAPFPNNASNVSLEKYDYIDCVDILESSADEIIYYLTRKAESFPNFRSAVTGYSFADLKDVYQNVQNNKLAKIYSYILNNKIASDRDLLIKRNENNRAKYIINIDNCSTRIAEMKNIMDKFGDKVLQQKSVSMNGANDDSDRVLDYVEGGSKSNQKQGKTETTYDQLISQYVALQSQEIKYQVKLGKCDEILEAYAGSDVISDPNSKEAKNAAKSIKEVAEEFNTLYDIVKPTVIEFNQKNGADNVAMSSSIQVSENINLKIFVLLAFIFFLIAGCGAAILCGRINDFIVYFMYTDKKTGLPNRNRCDMVIEDYERHLLPEEFVCLVFKVSLQYNDRPEFDHKDGDEILHSFGKFMGDVFSDADFAGYNNNGMFISFINGCSDDRAEVLVKKLQIMVDAYNTSAVYPISYTSAIASTTEEKIYSARELLINTVKKLPLMR